MQRATSAGPSGTGSPARAQAAASRLGMSPGGRNTGSSVSTTEVSGASPAASASRSPSSTARPAARQPRSDSCSSHRPVTLCRYRIRPSSPASLVNPARRLASVSTGASSSIPTSDQVPLEM